MTGREPKMGGKRIIGGGVQSRFGGLGFYVFLGDDGIPRLPPEYYGEQAPRAVSERAENGALDLWSSNLHFLGRPDFQSRGPQPYPSFPWLFCFTKEKLARTLTAVILF